MKRNAGAQAGEGKLESRFAALTSGLLARKGQAAPSNSPIHDPAEETDAFNLEPTHKADRKKPTSVDLPKSAAPKAAPAKSAPPETKPAAKEAPAPKKPAAPEPVAAKKTEAPAKAPPPSEIKLQPAERIAPEPLTVINERSYEAGYPDNPSAEEIAALEAEADEVVSYFENFGSEDAVALEKDDFYGDEDDDGLEDAFDDLDDEEDAAPAAPINGPWAGASVPPVAADAVFEVKAGVSVQLTAREFMRLSLGAAELEQSAQDLIAEAIEEYLDARGVLSLGGCACLETLTKKPGAA